MLELITRERTPLAPSQKAILASLEAKDWGEEDWDTRQPPSAATAAWSEGEPNDTEANGGAAASRKAATPADTSLFPKLISLGLEESLSDGPSARVAPGRASRS